MNKKHKKLIILLAVLAAVCVIYAAVTIFVSNYNEQKEKESEEADIQADESQEIVIMKVDGSTLSYLSYTHDNDGDGKDEDIVYNRLSDGKTWQWAGDTDLKLTSGIIGSYISDAAAEIKADRVIKNVTDEQFENYGLNSPTKTVVLKDDTNGEQTITFGTYNSYNAMYYVYLGKDKNTAYLVAEDVYKTFDADVEYFIELETLPKVEEEDCLVSLVYKAEGREVVCTFEAADPDSGKSGKWYRSVNGGEKTEIPQKLSDHLILLLCGSSSSSSDPGMEYLSCKSVYESELSDYGFTKDGDTISGKATMTLNYRTKTRKIDPDDPNGTNVIIEWKDHSKTFKLGDVDKYDYYYVNPDNSHITCLLGGSTYYKVFCLSDEELKNATIQ